MSGFIGSGLISGALTMPLQTLVSPQFLSGLLGGFLGGDIPNLILVLGGIPFFDLEIPENIHGGGDQSIHIHKYPGGIRTIDSMGPDDTELRWSGWFQAFEAENRARQLDMLRRQGSAVICSWSSYYYLVVIKKFEFQYYRSFHIGYSLELAVVQDLAAADAHPLTPIGGTDSVISLAMEAINRSVQGVVDTMGMRVL